MVKFGKTLNSRPAGREAVLRVRQILNGAATNEQEIIFDFLGVDLFTPSFADEFIHGVKQIYPDKQLKFEGINDTAIKEIIESISK